MQRLSDSARGSVQAVIRWAFARAGAALAVALVVSGCLLSGCDGGDDGPPGAAPTATVALPPATATASAAPALTPSPSMTRAASPTPPPSPTTAATETETSPPTATATGTATPTSTPTTLMLAAVSPVVESAPAGRELPVPLSVRVTNDAGEPLAGVEVDFSVRQGGGTAEPQRIATDADGTASARWTLGVVPVLNRLRAQVGDQRVLFDTRATLDTPYTPEPFSDVNGFMTENGLPGSTEDLAFDPSRIVLGIPGGLLVVDPQGVVTQMALSGDPLVNPLGVAFDGDGNIWVADSMGHALRRVSPSGEVTTVLTSDGTQDLLAPNYVAVDAAGRVYLSDPCLGELLRYVPALDAVDAILTFDLPNEGGPNGFAFDESGAQLYVATENTALFCGHVNVGLTDEIAGLFAVAVSDAGFGERRALATRVGLFGDGVAVDREDNVYVIFDKQQNFMLSESAVWVLPDGEEQLVKFLSVSDHVLANLAFGRSQFGNTTLYLSLLAIPPFTAADARGVERFETGIRGLRVPPNAAE